MQASREAALVEPKSPPARSVKHSTKKDAPLGVLKVVPFAAGQDKVVEVAVAVAAPVVLAAAVAVLAEEAPFARRAPQTPLFVVAATSVLFI